jgi:hypothetical protein
VDLLVVQLKAAIRRLLDNKGVRARVLDKVNRYGEVVIGVIIERPTPPHRVTLPNDEVPRRDNDDAHRDPRDDAHREEGEIGEGEDVAT